MAPAEGKVLVTGSNGFAARLLVTRLCDAGYEVIAGDVREPWMDPVTKSSIADPRAKCVILDVTDEAAVSKAVAGCTAIFHCGALVPYNLSRAYGRDELERVNVKGTLNLVRAAHSAGVQALLYASSTGVVFRGHPIANGDESLSTSLPLNDAYSDSKSMAEQAVLAANDESGMATLALRPNGIWGFGGEAHHIPKLLAAAQAGVAAFMATGPDALTDFSHRENLVRAFVLGLDRLLDGKGRAVVGGKAYFVTDGWPCHTLEFFSPLLQLLGFAAPYPSAFIPRSVAARHGLKHCCRLPWAQFNAVVADAAKEQQEQEGGNFKAKPGRASSSSTPRGKRRGSTTATLLDGAGEPGQPSAQPAQPRDEIVITSDPWLPLPGWILYVLAALLQGVSIVLRPLVNLEPFLTLADSRKVVQHNYYCSDAAARDLGYSPVVSPAQGLRETAVYYRALGYDGHVTAAGWLPWLLAPGGIALTGALAADLWGSGQGFVSLCTRAGIPMAAAANGLRSAVASAVSHLAYEGSAACLPSDSTAVWLLILRWTFIAAVLAHALEAVFVFGKAWRWRKAAGPWFLQTLALGFPSMRILFLHAGQPASAIVPVCLALFTACAVVTPLLDTLVACAKQ